MSTHTYAIEVHGLRKSYGDFEAVSGIDFTVAYGEVFCLLGPNGAGKTTTVEILEGYRTRSGGEVSVLGMDPGDAPRALRERVGIVLQECGVQPDLTVAELLRMYGSYYSRSLGAEELLSIVGLTEKRDERAKSLSGGQRRRLDLALGLVGDPDLIFLDEPTTGFDPHARRQAWEVVHSLCALGKTVVLTTHYMDEAQALANRIAIISGGRIIAAGTPADLGGRNQRPAEIRFTLAADMDLAELPALDAERREVNGEEVVLTTARPVEVVNRLTGWALERSVQLRGFSVTQPSLEDVYLELTSEAETGEPQQGSKTGRGAR